MRGLLYLGLVFLSQIYGWTSGLRLCARISESYGNVPMLTPFQDMQRHTHLDHALHVLRAAGSGEEGCELHAQAAELGRALVDVALASQRLVRLGGMPLASGRVHIG